MSFFENKTIWITGSSSGIGRAIAIEASGKGASLILSARSTDRLQLVKEECARSPHIEIIPLDLEDHDGLKAIFEKHRSALSKVDILINNGGISQRSLVKETTFDVYRRLMDVNYLGTIALSLLMLEVFLKKESGHFVTISSMAGKFGVPLRSGYSASKMALHGFFESMRAEHSSDNLDITMVCPGFINTNVSKNALTGNGTPTGIADNAQLRGMSAEKLAKKLLIAIERKEEEILIGGYKETKLANRVNRFFPSLFKKVIAKSKVT